MNIFSYTFITYIFFRNWLQLPYAIIKSNKIEKKQDIAVS